MNEKEKNNTRIRKIVCSALCAFTLTGCAFREDTMMHMEKDGDFNLAYVTAIDEESIDYLLTYMAGKTGEITEEDRWSFIESYYSVDELNLPAGYKYERYDEDGMKGILLRTPDMNIKDVSAETAASRTNMNHFNETEGDILFLTKDNKTFTSNMSASLAGSDDFPELSDYMDTSEMEIYSSFILVTSLDVKDHNAAAIDTSKSEKRYEWDMTKAETENIDFTVTIGSSINVVPYLLAVLMALCAAAFVLVTQKKKNEA